MKKTFNLSSLKFELIDGKPIKLDHSKNSAERRNDRFRAGSSHGG